MVACLAGDDDMGGGRREDRVRWMNVLQGRARGKARGLLLWCLDIWMEWVGADKGREGGKGGSSCVDCVVLPLFPSIIKTRTGWYAYNNRYGHVHCGAFAGGTKDQVTS